MVRILRERMRDRRIWAIAAVFGLAFVAAALIVGRGGEDSATSTTFSSAGTTLSVIGGAVQVVSSDGASARSGRDGEALAPGATVQTQGPDGRAVLTFRDGSTVELEPDASIQIEEHSLGTRGELIVRLDQDRGKTWSHVQPQLSPNSRFHVKTPSGTAVARGTSFGVDVNRAGGTGTLVTSVTVFEGRVDLVAGGAVVPLAASYSSEVAAGSAPLPARRFSTSDLCMRMEVTITALVTITDPDGRTAGQTAIGTVSQIPNTIVTGPQTEPQAVDIFSPMAGEWELAIVPRGEGGELQVIVTTVLGAQTVSQHAMVSTIQRGQRVVTRIRLGDDGRVGRFDAPTETTETRANIALPSEGTTTAPLPMARVFPPTADQLVLTCGTPRSSESTDGVRVVPLGSPTPSGR